ncbi:hypothetical protein COCOR_00004 [Corallococcus coralloides DSM 2259]|uniref:Uncharacterized protein n=1 Tax=Corallococcus coralloides (strain ATCC 25202 / DSM 2259 / NBRC 100086 / M2) TaxID=1144275 RepID=H8MRW8_CORCM|nr:hypothetical protein [Corallococcus coralloides]AFE03205.1 hypothetical protein COCOR_00004 [Corallococcus coralloides DSM 2259]
MTLGLSGCNTGTHTRLIFSLNSNSPGGASLAVPASGVRAMTDPGGPPEFGSGDGMRFQLVDASVRVSDIRLELAGGLGCDDVREQLPEGTGCVQPEGSPATVTLAGPFAINLPSGEAFQAVLEIPPSTYRRLDFVLGQNGFTAQTLHAGDSTWGMDLALPEGTAMASEAASDLTLEEGGSLRVLFNQDAWLKELPLLACYQNGDWPRPGPKRSLDEVGGECQGAGDRVRDAIRTQLKLQTRSF